MVEEAVAAVVVAAAEVVVAVVDVVGVGFESAALAEPGENHKSLVDYKT